MKSKGKSGKKMSKGLMAMRADAKREGESLKHERGESAAKERAEHKKGRKG